MNLQFLEKEKFDDLVEKVDLIIEKLDQKLKPADLADKWLTTKEAAKALQVTPRSLQNYRDRGIIPFSQFGREVRYLATDIQQFLMDHQTNLRQLPCYISP